MRYALIFAGVAAAYDAYGDSRVSSSTPVAKYSTTSAAGYGVYGEDYKTSSKPASSKATPTSSKIGYTTIYPGYGKEPVTVTSQYQAYPTCGAAGSDGKSCDKWNEDKYVSTVINDYNSKKVTVTDVEKPITVYHTKTTITHQPTASSAGDKDGQAYATGSYGYKNNSTKPWYELYEKVHEIKYKELGAHGLPGYGGSGLCKSCDDEQPYTVKEYKDGKWSEYQTKSSNKAPVPETKTYEKPGVYTEPAKDVTVTYTMTKPSEATTTAKAGVPLTFGGYTTDFKETGVKTVAYGAYETGKDSNGQVVTSTVVKTVTVTVSATGKYEVAKPTTTVYDKDTEVKYPTVSVYQPGVYHKDEQIVTITKAGQTYGCDYKQTKTFPSEPSKTPSKDDDYPHGGKSSSKPADYKSSTEYKPDYPVSTPSVGKSSSKPYDPEHPVSTPSVSKHNDMYPATSSVPSHDEDKSYSASFMPSKETATKPYSEYPISSEYPSYSASSKSYDDEHKSSSVSSMPSKETATKSYNDEFPATSSAPCTTSSVSGHDEYKSYSASSSEPSKETMTKSADYEPSSTPAEYHSITFTYETTPAKTSEYESEATSSAEHHAEPTSSAEYYETSTSAEYEPEVTSSAEHDVEPTPSAEYNESSSAEHHVEPTPSAEYNESSSAEHHVEPTTSAGYPEVTPTPAEYIKRGRRVSRRRV